MKTLLDAFCCQGGAAEGYRRAGFHVTGLDNKARHLRHYVGNEGILVDDAITYIIEHGVEYDAIHASPPCQRYTHGNAGRVTNHPDLVGRTRDALISTGRPYVLENVPRAPLVDPVVLCGTMFDLTAVDDDGTKLYLQRHRLFETNWDLPQPGHEHPKDVQWAGAYGGARRDKHEARNVRKGGYVPRKTVLQQLLGVNWMTLEGMYECLPPAYTAYIGHHLLERM